MLVSPDCSSLRSSIGKPMSNYFRHFWRNRRTPRSHTTQHTLPESAGARERGSRRVNPVTRFAAVLIASLLVTASGCSLESDPDRSPEQESDRSSEADQSERLPELTNRSFAFTGSTEGEKEDLTANVDGDPHLSAFPFDYDLQLEGEFVLVRDTAGDLEVQTRFQRCCGSDDVTAITAVVLQVAGSIVEGRQTPTGRQVLVNGEPLNEENASLPAGSVSFSEDAGLVADWPDGSRLQWQGTSIRLSISEQRAGRLEGLLGDGVASSIAGRDGAAYGPEASAEDIHYGLGNSWRILPDESLFTYAEGQSTDSFTDITIPSSLDPFESLDPGIVEAAREQCAAAGIEDDALLAGCALDVAVSGEDRFIEGAAESQMMIDRFREGVVNPVAPDVLPTAGYPVRLASLPTTEGVVYVDGLLIQPERDVFYGRQWEAVAISLGEHVAVAWTPQVSADYAPEGAYLTVDGEVVAVDDNVLAETETLEFGGACGGRSLLELEGGAVAIFDAPSALHTLISLATDEFVVGVKLSFNSRRAPWLGGLLTSVTDGADVDLCLRGEGLAPSVGLLGPDPAVYDFDLGGCREQDLYPFAAADGEIVCTASVAERREVISQWALTKGQSLFGLPAKAP